MGRIREPGFPGRGSGAEAENGCVPETADAVRRRLPAREAARRRQAVATLRLAEAVARYAADQMANGLAPGEARAAAIDAAGELAELAALLRKLTRLGPAERRELALELRRAGLGVSDRLGISRCGWGSATAGPAAVERTAGPAERRELALDGRLVGTRPAR